MKVGYSYWGFLGDVKLDKDGNKLSTPDGNAFYSWSIIKGLQDRGAEVYQMMPDRDRPGRLIFGLDGMFKNFAQYQRMFAYSEMYKNMYVMVDWKTITKDELKQIWKECDVDKFDVILHEWRMEIPGRNSLDMERSSDWQPDYFIQKALLEFCIEYKVSLIIFDLDYKITKEEYIDIYNKSPLVHLFELGHKWDGVPNCEHVEIPFSFDELKRGIKPLRENYFVTELIYIGNRYERDEYVDKYIPNGNDIDISFYGNWLQPGYDDCVKKWPNITFGNRLQAKSIPWYYDRSVCTILLAKDEYYKNGFMTARILEALYYGCLPLFPIEYGKDIIEKYAGAYSKMLTVGNKEDVRNIVEYYSNNIDLRNEVIQYLREHLGFMDYQYITNSIISIGGGHTL